MNNVFDLLCVCCTTLAISTYCQLVVFFVIVVIVVSRVCLLKGVACVIDNPQGMEREIDMNRYVKFICNYYFSSFSLGSPGVCVFVIIFFVSSSQTGITVVEFAFQRLHFFFQLILAVLKFHLVYVIKYFQFLCKFQSFL